MTAADYLFHLRQLAADVELSEGARAMLRVTLDANLTIDELAACLSYARDALAGLTSSDAMILAVGGIVRKGLYDEAS